MYGGYRLERRRYKRLRINLAVIYQIEGPKFVYDILGDKDFEARTLDLSEGGVALIVGHYLPINTKLSIKITIFESDHTGLINFYDPLIIKGVVKSNVLTESNEYRLGIEFTDVVQEKQHRLADFVYSPLRVMEEPLVV